MQLLNKFYSLKTVRRAGLVWLILLTSLIPYAQGLSKENAKQIYKSIFAIVRTDFRPFFKLDEVRVFDKTKDSISESELDYIGKTSGNTIVMPLGLVQRFFNIFAMEEFTFDTSLHRQELKKIYGSLYDAVSLQKTRLDEFLGVFESQPSKLSLNTDHCIKSIEASLLYVYLHEIAHLIYDSENKRNTESAIELTDGNEAELKADDWVLDFIFRVDKITTIFRDFDPLILTFTNFEQYNPSHSLYHGKHYFGAYRIINFLEKTKNYLCSNSYDTSSKATCSYIEKQIQIYMKEDTNYLAKKNTIEGWKNWRNDNFTILKDGAQKLDSFIYSNGQNTAYIKYEMDNVLFEFSKQSIVPMQYWLHIDAFGECFLNGSYGFKPDISKALIVYELFAMQSDNSFLNVVNRPYYSYIDSRREHYCLIAAMINQYYFKEYQKASFFYRNARQIHSVLPIDYYDFKINTLKDSVTDLRQHAAKP